MELSDLFLMIPKLLFPLLILIVGLYFLIAKSKAKEEKSQTPVYKTWCYGVINGFKQPGIRFAIYDNFIVVSHYKKQIIRTDEIDNIEPGTYMTAKGVSINLKRSASGTIFLMPKHLDQVINLLNKFVSNE